MGPDGNLYVLEAMDVQIVVVDPTGQFVGRIGRKGGGARGVPVTGRDRLDRGHALGDGRRSKARHLLPGE